MFFLRSGLAAAVFFALFHGQAVAPLVFGVPGVAFEAEGYCRLSYAVSLENINKGLDRIEEFVRSLD